MNATNMPVDNIEEASILLDGSRVLTPGSPEYRQFYVSRPKVESRLVREAKRAEMADRPFLWCFTGHTGSGKSTELNRILSDPDINEKYLPILIDLEAEFDVHGIQYTDLILAMGKGCVTLAENEGCNVPKPLRKAIRDWGSVIFTEKETNTRTEGQGGLKLSFPFLKLSEEIRSGGGKREVVRKEIDDHLTEFIRLIDELGKMILDHTRRRVLCVLDGLDHVDEEPCFNLINDHFNTLKRPAISKIFVIPLALLNRPFQATIGGDYSAVHNIKVFSKPNSLDIDPYGFSFYKDVISRYATLEIFEDKALDSLFRLSAGIVRDMIRNTGDACAYAYESGSSRVSEKHAERMWDEVTRFYRSQLFIKDYDVLRRIKDTPQIKGIDDLPHLLHRKAVVFYPNGEGWYGVHPAVSKML